MLTYKNTSSKSCEKGMRSIDGFKNTKFIGWAGAKAGDWAKELKKLRADEAWKPLISVDPETGRMKYDPCVEIQVYDAGNGLISRDGKSLPGLADLECLAGYTALITELMYFKRSCYFPLPITSGLHRSPSSTSTSNSLLDGARFVTLYVFAPASGMTLSRFASHSPASQRTLTSGTTGSRAKRCGWKQHGAFRWRSRRSGSTAQHSPAPPTCNDALRPFNLPRLPPVALRPRGFHLRNHQQPPPTSKPHHGPLQQPQTTPHSSTRKLRGLPVGSQPSRPPVAIRPQGRRWVALEPLVATRSREGKAPGYLRA